MITLLPGRLDLIVTLKEDKIFRIFIFDLFLYRLDQSNSVEGKCSASQNDGTGFESRGQGLSGPK